MDAVTSGAKTTRNSPPPQAVPSLPREIIIKIASFCEKCEGLLLYMMGSKEYRTALFEKVRDAQIFLVRGVGERLEKSGILDDQMQRVVSDEQKRTVETIREKATIEEVTELSLEFAKKLIPVEGEHEVWMHPFHNVVNRKVRYGHQFIPSDLENRVCEAVISISCLLFGDRPRLEEAVRLMRKGTFDYTEESSKIEQEGKSYVLAGLAKALIFSENVDIEDMHLFLDIIKRITPDDLQYKILRSCKNYCLDSSRMSTDVLYFLVSDEFFFLLSPNIQPQFIEDGYFCAPQYALKLGELSSNPAVKRRVLEMNCEGCEGKVLYQEISNWTKKLFQILDIARGVPLEERIGRVFGIIDRLEKICRPHQGNSLAFEDSWDRSFRRLYVCEPNKDRSYLTAALLKILIIDEGWGREPTEKMVEDAWRFLDEFPAVDKVMCAHILFMHALAYVQDEETCKEVFKLIFDKVNRIRSEAARQAFVQLFLVQGLDHLKENEFVSYEYLIDQIKGIIKGMKQERSRLMLRYSFKCRVIVLESKNSKRIGRGVYTEFYVLAGALQEVFPRGAERDGQIMELYKQLYKAHNMKGDSMAQRMMGELVEQMENEEKKRTISWMD